MKKRLLSIGLLLFWLYNFSTFSQNDSAKIEYEKRIVQDSINGIYIPKDLNDCILQLNKLLPDSSKIQIKTMPEQEFRGAVHFSMGMWIRNNWGLWGGSRLQVYLINKGFEHPDDMSDFILTCYHRSLQGQKIDVEEEIKKRKK